MKVELRSRPWPVSPLWKDVLCSSRVLYSDQYEKHAHNRPATCTRQATFTIDGQPYCTIHAGILALDHLLKKSTDR